MNLTPEQILENWNRFLSVIDQYIESPRKEQLLEFYQKYEERFSLMPASHKSGYHNSFPGGYIDHVLRVIDASLELDKVWRKFDCKDNYTTEELVFSAINHDLGKFGDFDHEAVVEQTDEWRKTKLGEMYQFNTKLTYMSVPDRGLWLLSQSGIEVSKNEWLAIKLHDGLYDESNKPYLLSWAPETKLRTSLPIIIHQADMMAARIEFEREWLDKLNGTPVEQPKPVSTQKYKQQTQISIPDNSNLKDIMSNFFE